MRKWFIAAMCTGFVFSSGLVSCSKENKSSDVYAPPAPKVRTLGGPVALHLWDQVPQKSLDLQFQFDVRDAQPAHFSVQTTCRVDKTDYHFFKDFEGAPEVSLYQLYPEELLSVDVNKVPVLCGFEFALYNGAGSKHVFNLPFATVTDVNQGAVQVRLEPDSRSNPAFPYPVDQPGLRLRYSNFDPATARLFCDGFRTSTLPFEKVIDVAQFALTSATAGIDGNVLQQHPLQTCRAEIRQNDLRIQISNLFVLRFPELPLAVQVTQSPYNAFTGAPAAAAAFRQLAGGQPLLLKQWSVTNPAGSPRKILLASRALTFNLEADVSVTKKLQQVLLSSLQHLRFARAWATAAVVRDPQLEMSDEGNAQTVQLAPGQSLTIQLWVNPAGKLHCDQLADFVGGRIQGLELPKFEESTGYGEFVAEHALEVEPAFYLTQQNEAARAASGMGLAFNCAWP